MPIEYEAVSEGHVSMGETGRQGCRLPVWRTILDSYAIVARNLPALLKSGWPLLSVSLVAAFALRWVTWPLSSNAMDGLPAEGGIAGSEVAAVWLIVEVEPVVALLPFLAVLPTVARLHRFVVSGLAIDTQPLRDVAASAYRCFKAYVVLFVPVTVLLVALVISDLNFSAVDDASAEDVSSGLSFYAAMVLVGLWMVFYPRPALRVAAVANGATHVRWRDVWSASAGNTMRLILCFALVVMPVALSTIVIFWSGEPSGRIGSALYVVLDSAVTMLMVVLETALLSVAYLHFFKPDTAGSAHDVAPH